MKQKIEHLSLEAQYILVLETMLQAAIGYLEKEVEGYSHADLMELVAGTVRQSIEGTPQELLERYESTTKQKQEFIDNVAGAMYPAHFMAIKDTDS